MGQVLHGSARTTEAVCRAIQHSQEGLRALPSASRHQSATRGHRRQNTKAQVKAYPIGYFHVDIAEVQTAEGKLRLFVAIDRTSKFAFVELHQEGGKMGTPINVAHGDDGGLTAAWGTSLAA